MAIKRITTNLIKDSDIATVDIANNAITAAKITDGNITTAKLADLSVTAGKLAGTLDLTGKTITVATATTGDNDTSPASTAFVQQEIAALVDSSPDSLNTLNELAAALGDDASFSTTVTNSIATKLPLAGGTVTGVTTFTGGDGVVVQTSSDTFLQLKTTGSGSNYIEFKNSGGAAGNIRYNHSTNLLSVKTNGTDNRLVIDSSGNIGIGTPSPSTPAGNKSLHIAGTTGAELILERDDSGVAADDFIGGLAFLNSDGSNTPPHYLGITARAFNEFGASQLEFFSSFEQYPSGTPDMVLDASGRVGIGTVTPAKNLEILGSGSESGILVKNDTNTNYRGYYISSVESDNTAYGKFHMDLNSGELNITSGYSGWGGFITIDTNGAERMRISSSDITLKPGNGTVIVDGGTADYEPAKVELQGRAFGGDITAKYEVSDGGVVFFGSTTNHDVRFLRNSAEKLTIDAQVNVKGAKTLLSGTITNMLNVIDTTSAASGVGGGIQFLGAYTGSTVTTFASIEGIKANGTGGNYAGHLIIKTRDNGGNNEERLRLYSDDGAGGYGRMKLTSSYGAMTIGASNSSYHHFIRDSGPSTFYFSNRCEANGGFHTYSDERLKENITPITNALDKVSQMNGITFSWIDAENRGGGDTGKQFGVTAQNMLEVDSELPSLNKDPLASQDEIDNEESTDYYSMDYNRITPFLIEAIKEQQTIIDDLKSRLDEAGI